MRIGQKVKITPGWTYWDVTNCPPWDTQPIYHMVIKEALVITVTNISTPKTLKKHFTDFEGVTDDGRMIRFEMDKVEEVT